MLTKEQLLSWLSALIERFQEKKEYLTELDTAIGDADHGNNLNRGFQKVKVKLPEVEEKSINDILKTVSMTLISSVGGASGPLYGTFFLEAAMKLGKKEALNEDDVVTLWESGINGVIKRGKAEAGDKTMIDTLLPALETLKKSIAAGDAIPDALAKASESARAGMESTIPMIARKGRASYLGERSKDHQDPGATSAYYMVELMAEVAAR